MRGALLLVLAMSVGGCTVAPLDENALEPAKNKCAADSDCGAGACDTQLGICRAASGDFGSVLFEVTPPANSDKYSGVAYLKSFDLAHQGGNFDLALGVLTKVTGQVNPTKSSYQGDCLVAYGVGEKNNPTAPVKITFAPNSRVLGLEAQEYTAKTSFDSASGVFKYEVWMPPDDYDVYIQPEADSADYLSNSCTVVPQVSHFAPESPGDWTYDIGLNPPSLLAIDVLWPLSEEKTALEGWTVDVLDPITGRVISAPAKLAFFDDPNDLDNDHYVANVEYSTVSAEGLELVRIKPREGVIAPTLVYERRGLEALTPGQAKIDQLKTLPPAKIVTGLQLVTDDKKAGVSASVRFVSTELDLPNSPSGTQAFFEQTVEATDGVVADLELLSGTYDVFVAPDAASGFATTKGTLSVGDNQIQGGKTIVLQKVSDVGGNILLPGGGPAVGAPVQAVASPVNPTTFEMTVGATPFKPKSETTVVGTDGRFSFHADPGTFDFSVRPPDGTDFAWLVRPNVEVQSGIHDLGEMTLPLPVVYQGTVTVPGGAVPAPVPGSLIRAYIYLNASGYTENRAGAKAVVQIAETRAGSDGTFQLFLPSHLN